MSIGTITMTSEEYDALFGRIAALSNRLDYANQVIEQRNGELAKLQGEYEWVVSINEALNESNIRAWADLTFLAEYVVGREYGATLPNYEALGRYPLDVAGAVIAAARQEGGKVWRST